MRSVVPSFYKDRRSSSQHLTKILGKKMFDFPKDVGVLSRWISVVTSRDPNAVVLDFFAGSGSTAEAVMRLNAGDDAREAGSGRRQCILITNNEVDENTAKALVAEGHRPGDPKWEEGGIFRRVTRPRIETVITGNRADGSEYSKGLAENVTFLELTYLDRTDVERGRAFAQVTHLLWAQAGATGDVIDEANDSWAAPEGARYAILFDVDRWHEFLSAVRDRSDLKLVFVVTDSDTAFSNVAQALPNHVKAAQLYEDYLSTFEINTREG